MPPADGRALHGMIGDLLLLPRSLTGPGVRETLRQLGPDVELHEVASGTPVLDWRVPEEWTLRSAVLTGPDGAVIVDAAVHPLHVLGYSVAVDTELDLEDLQPHLHSDPDQPEVIPYRTSYYAPRWGFCLADRQRRSLEPGRYRVRIDATHAPGHLTYGERVVRGESDEEVLVCSHICHPGMANDNLSGNVVAAAVADHVASLPQRRLTWRFLWMPGTIGEITWLALHPDVVPRVLGGLVLAGVGDPGHLRWKRSRRGDGLVDRAATAVLAAGGTTHEVVGYSPWGYAERQFNSLGFDIPVGRLSRSEHATYAQYHTSEDDLSFVTPASLAEAVAVTGEIVAAVEANARYRNRKPHGEPRLGVRGLYPTMGGPAAETAQLALLWVLSESDGRSDLLDIAGRSGLAPAALAQAAQALLATDLLEGAGDT